MRWRDLLFGRPLASGEQKTERIGPLQAIPILGLDALASAAYGPEAALTVLWEGGRDGSAFIVPISAAIIVLLVIVCWSYRQTIEAYPDGGSSYTVARENLGHIRGLLAAATLCTDYVLNVAIGISAGVGAFVSAVPTLLPHALSICLAILALLTLINLRGVRSTGAALALPTYLFVAFLGITLLWGVMDTGLGGAPPAETPFVPVGAAAGGWLLLRSFASGCTALTGVEAVSNATPLFKEPSVPRAQATLTIIMAILAVLLAGIAWLSRTRGIQATPPGTDEYRSVLSEVVESVAGRGTFYYATMASILSVLCLSANTSFSAFPRVCRLLALDQALPLAFAHPGPRLVFGRGILVLSLVSGALLIAFGGRTDRLIPLFAIGAFAAFTLSQLGMVVHWRRRKTEQSAKRNLAINTVGALVTGTTCAIIAVAKFTAGAWVTLLVIPLLVVLFWALQRRGATERALKVAHDPISLGKVTAPLALVPIRSFDRVGRSGLELAMTLSSDVEVVQVLTDDPDEPDLRPNGGSWSRNLFAPRRCPPLGLR